MVEHQGEIFGIPATGKIIKVTILLMLTLVDGKILRDVRVYDFTDMLRQLGVLRAKA